MYFEKPGSHNTEKTVEAAFKTAVERGIKHIVIASTWGETARIAASFLEKNPDLNVVVVTHNTGFRTPGIQEFKPDIREFVEKNGIKALTATMPTRTLGRAIKDKVGFSQEDIACAAWRMFGQGTKVCVEIAGMACDAGLVPPGDIVAVAGTGKGADTAMIISADSSNRTFNMKVREFLVKPAGF